MESSGTAHRPAAGSADASTRMQARAVLQVGSRRIDMLLGAACWCESDSCSARQQADAVLLSTGNLDSETGTGGAHHAGRA